MLAAAGLLGPLMLGEAGAWSTARTPLELWFHAAPQFGYCTRVNLVYFENGLAAAQRKVKEPGSGVTQRELGYWEAQTANFRQVCAHLYS